MRPFVLALCALLTAVFVAAPVEAQYQVGDPVGDFTLNDPEGMPVSLYDYEDTVILLNFWTDT